MDPYNQGHCFTLVFDNVGVKYTPSANVNHILDTLQDLYKITIDWRESHYIGIDLCWDYKLRMWDLSMKGYIVAALEQLCFK